MTNTAPPVAFSWDGEHMIPLNPRLADRHYVVGERYNLVEWHDRSEMSHRHMFSWLAEAHANLPEHLADSMPTPGHLRKRALIEAGFYDEEVIDCGSKAGALRVASYVRGHDDFAVVIVRGPVVVVRSAKSQSRRAMDRETFARSKSAILEVVAGMLGVSPETLQRERAA